MEIRLYYSITRLLLFVFTLIIFVVCGASEDGELNGLPYCNPDSSSSKYDHEKYVFVSTLDGRLSALNAKDGGTVAWSINTGPGPLLSSSIHRLELENNGHLVRMIPSLRGGLYKFNGDNIEVVPITADRLLQSSFLFSDDLVISGGKESRSYGISMKTGRILYECSIQGCDNYTEGISVEKDVLVIQRQTQTVRAIEARNGQERKMAKFNFRERELLAEICHNYPIIADMGYSLEIINKKKEASMKTQAESNSINPGKPPKVVA